MRTFTLAVTGFALSVAACSSYGTSVVEVSKPHAVVASVSISLPRSLVAGETARAIATVKDAGGTTLSDRPVAWFTSSASVASVTDSGVISAVAPGDAVLSAVSEGVAGQASVAVISPPPVPTPVATILVVITPASLAIGQKARATATLEDANGNLLTGRSLTWQSSNANVASVAPTGDVTSVGAGTAGISASSEGQTGSATLTVVAPAPIPVASVTISPATATLNVGATAQLTATTRDNNNNILSGRTIIWTSGNTTIASVSSLGLVTALAAGSTQIIASSEGQTAIVAITVRAVAPVPVASVIISPSSAVVQIGASIQLAATTRDSSNNVLSGRAVSWSSANSSIASVSQTGVVTAVAAGTADVSAVSEGKTGVSTITVTAPSPPPTGSSNEPAGFTAYTDQPFNSLPSDGWTGYNSYGIVLDNTAPKSPSAVFEVVYPAGYPGGNAPGAVEKFIPNPTALYMAAWVKYSPNFQGHNSLVNKIFHFWINDQAGAGNHLIISAQGSGSDPLYPAIRLQGVQAGGNQSGTTGNYQSAVPIIRGQWAFLEVIAVANTGSNRDGTVQLFLNGVLVASCSGIEFVTANNNWGDFTISPTWGGEGDVVANTQFLRIDHVYLSGNR